MLTLSISFSSLGPLTPQCTLQPKLILSNKTGAKMLAMAYGRSHGLPIVTTRDDDVFEPNQFP